MKFVIENIKHNFYYKPIGAEGQEWAKYDDRLQCTYTETLLGEEVTTRQLLCASCKCSSDINFKSDDMK